MGYNGPAPGDHWQTLPTSAGGGRVLVRTIVYTTYHDKYASRDEALAAMPRPGEPHPNNGLKDFGSRWAGEPIRVERIRPWAWSIDIPYYGDRSRCEIPPGSRCEIPPDYVKSMVNEIFVKIQISVGEEELRKIISESIVAGLSAQIEQAKDEIRQVAASMTALDPAEIAAAEAGPLPTSGPEK
jgi:hypothetical protein